MVWSQMKRTHNTKFTLTEMEQLTHRVFEETTPACWKFLNSPCPEHSEDHYWELDWLQMELVDEFIIYLEGDTDSDSESDVTSSEDDSGPINPTPS